MAVQAARKKKRADAITRWGLRLGAFVAFAGLWELSTAGLQSLLIPTFSQTFIGVFQLMLSGRIWEPLMVSNQALVFGYLLSVGLGLPIGLAMARARRIESIVNPYIAVVLAVPVAPLIPVIMMAMGLGLSSRVFVVFLFAAVFITVNTRAGVRNVDRSLIEMATSFGASERDIWWKVLIPGAMPPILAGLRIGLGRAVTGMVIVELLLVASGVGKLMLEFRGLFQKELLFAVVFIVLIESLLLMFAMRAMERKLAPWASDISAS